MYCHERLPVHPCHKRSKTIQALGHSMNAVSLPQGSSLTFEFDCPWEGEAVLSTAVIPTQPNDKGDIRFSVSIDGENRRYAPSAKKAVQKRGNRM